MPTELDAIIDTTLADNGGPTLTHALVLGSPAIDQIAIDGLHCDPPNSTDQRGAARANGTNAGGTACDAGAFELSGETPTAVFLHNATVRPDESQTGVFAAALAALSAVTFGFWRRFKSQN